MGSCVIPRAETTITIRREAGKSKGRPGASANAKATRKIARVARAPLNLTRGATRVCSESSRRDVAAEDTAQLGERDALAKRARQPVAHPELDLPEVRKSWQPEGLFSDHYLKARIQQNSWWPTDDQTRPLWRSCKELYEKRYLACAKNNEAFTRQELLDRVLEWLGVARTGNLRPPGPPKVLGPH